MKSNATKTHCQRAHFKTRFAQRFGVTINRHDIRDIVTLIKTHKCNLVARQSTRVRIFDVPWKGKVYRIVYDKFRDTPVTVLPENATEYNEEEELEDQDEEV